VDKASGTFFDRERFHPAAHIGEHFKVLGGLNVSRSPQGHPVIFQAGSSGKGREVAAATADAVFTVQESLDASKSFYRTMKAQVAAQGRDPDGVLVMPGLLPVIGRSRSEAAERLEQLNALIHPSLGLELLSTLIGHDLSGYDVD